MAWLIINHLPLHSHPDVTLVLCGHWEHETRSSGRRSNENTLEQTKVLYYRICNAKRGLLFIFKMRPLIDSYSKRCQVKLKQNPCQGTISTKSQLYWMSLAAVWNSLAADWNSLSNLEILFGSNRSPRSADLGSPSVRPSVCALYAFWLPRSLPVAYKGYKW